MTRKTPPGRLLWGIWDDVSQFVVVLVSVYAFLIAIEYPSRGRSLDFLKFLSILIRVILAGRRQTNTDIHTRI